MAHLGNTTSRDISHFYMSRLFEQPRSNKGSLFDLVDTDPRLVWFKTITENANMIRHLASLEDVTILVKNSTGTPLEYSNLGEMEKMTALEMYHYSIIPRAISAKTLGNWTLTSRNGKDTNARVIARGNGFGYSRDISNIKFVVPDILATNGIIHIIE